MDESSPLGLRIALLVFSAECFSVSCDLNTKATFGLHDSYILEGSHFFFPSSCEEVFRTICVSRFYGTSSEHRTKRRRKVSSNGRGPTKLASSTMCVRSHHLFSCALICTYDVFSPFLAGGSKTLPKARATTANEPPPLRRQTELFDVLVPRLHRCWHARAWLMHRKVVLSQPCWFKDYEVF